MRLSTVFLLAITAALVIDTGATRQAVAQDVTTTEKQLQTLKKDIGKIQQRLQQREKQRKDEQSALAAAEKSINRITQQLRELEQEVGQLGDQRSDLLSQKDVLEQEVAEQKNLILSLIKEQYRQGQQPRLQLLLKHESPDDFERMIRYYDHINRQVTSQIRAFESTLQRLQSTQRTVVSTESSLSQRRQQLESERKALTSAQQTRQKTLANLAKSMQNEQQQLANLQRNQKELESLLSELQATLAKTKASSASTRFTQMKGRLPWPTNGTVRRSFGHVHNGLKFEGLLIDGQAGANVNAAHAGRVIFSDWLRGYGLVLIIDHGSGYMSLYGHNESLLHDVGAWVNTGDTIAKIGTSGGNDNPGLYFSIRHQGKPVNPTQWLAKP